MKWRNPVTDLIPDGITVLIKLHDGIYWAARNGGNDHVYGSKLGSRFIRQEHLASVDKVIGWCSAKDLEGEEE